MSDWSDIVDELKGNRITPAAPPRKVTPNSAGSNMDLVMAAMEAALSADMAKEAAAKAAHAKDRLFSIMRHRNIDSIAMPDRDNISIKTGSSKKMTLKALKEAIGEEEAMVVWGKLGKHTYTSLSVPKRRELEPGDE